MAAKRLEGGGRKNKAVPGRPKRTCRALTGTLRGTASSQPGCQPSPWEESAAPLTLLEGIAISGQAEARDVHWPQSKWSELPQQCKRQGEEARRDVRVQN